MRAALSRRAAFHRGPLQAPSRMTKQPFLTQMHSTPWQRALSGHADAAKVGVDGNSPVSSLRTGTTAALWKRRLELEAYKKGATKQQTVLVDKHPSDSRFSMSLLVASDPAVKSQYLNFRGGIRFGKVLEDIDAFAGNVAFLHCDDGSPETKQHTLVTACLDRVDLQRPITLASEDLVMQGNATWAGRSSLQISVSLHRASDMEPLLQGSMVFVSVGADGKGVAINPLTPQTALEESEFVAGAAGNEKRKTDRKMSLNAMHPTDHETMHLHRVMMNPPKGNGVPIAATRCNSTILMQPQEKNRAGKIFGGFLMREAYELAYTTASAFVASAPAFPGGNGAATVASVDDVSFAKPVSIGDVLAITSQVVYSGSDEVGAEGGFSSGPIASVFQVRVEIEIIDLVTGTRRVSNEFHFTFVAREIADGNNAAKFVNYPLKPVIPTTYKEGMWWLDGRRRMIEAITLGKASKSTFFKDI